MRQMIGKQWKKLCKPNILMVKLIVGIQLIFKHNHITI